MIRLTYEQRKWIREEISKIQTTKENSARRMKIKTRYRTTISMGGDSRPFKEQIRSGYPPPKTDEDNPWNIHNRKKAA